MALLALAVSGFALADDDATPDEPTVVPYRPTVSNPADLSTPGWLEAEVGGQRVLAADRSQSTTVPYLAKYAFTETSGILVGGNVYDREVAGADRHSGFGDTFVEWKQKFPIAEGFAFGVEAGALFPTAPDAIGVGKTAWIVNGIVSRDLGEYHVDVNAGGVRYGDAPARASRWQSTWAAAISRSFGQQFGGALEISGSDQRGASHAHQALAAINYNFSRRLVFDAGFARGLDRGAHDKTLFAGGTFLLGRPH